MVGEVASVRRALAYTQEETKILPSHLLSILLRYRLLPESCFLSSELTVLVGLSESDRAKSAGRARFSLPFSRCAPEESTRSMFRSPLLLTCLSMSLAVVDMVSRDSQVIRTEYEESMRDRPGRRTTRISHAVRYQYRRAVSAHT